jgi:uncharacterized protein
LPDLHVIAAGSLLEFAMGKVQSFPVGRVEHLYLFPLNFQEFLNAIDHQRAFEELNHVPVRDFAGQVLMKLFHIYAITGGMPEVVKNYAAENSFINLPRVYESIWATYKKDVEKYAKNDTEKKVIRHIMATSHNYLDQRIIFQNFGNSNYRSREVGEAMRSLDNANVIQLIYPTTSLEIPIKSDFKKKPKIQFLDTGLINHVLGIQSQLIGINDLSTAYKGAITPHLVTQELISSNTITYKKPNFWVREKKQSSAEVDLVIPHGDKVIPLEIKSGKTGTLKSLHQFIDKSGHPYAVRLYAGEFQVDKHITPAGTPYLLMNLPYYLGTKITEYIEYFITTYKL